MSARQEKSSFLTRFLPPWAKTDKIEIPRPLQEKEKVEKLQEVKKTCPWCSQYYNDNLHLPKILPDCLHVFCSECIISRQKSNYESTGKIYFDCFICQRMIYRNLDVLALSTDFMSITTRPSVMDEILRSVHNFL